MSKNTFFFGQPIFSQIVGLIPKAKVNQIANDHQSDRYTKKFTTFQHLITMLYGVVSGCNSLRELCLGIVSYGDKISHCKFDYAPNKSSLSDANKRRDCKVFEAIYYNLLESYLPDLSDSRKSLFIDKKVYAIDSTTISLFQPIFECVGRKSINGKSKGGIKSHQKLDLQAGIPVKVYHSSAKEHDSLFIQHQDVVNKGEIAVFDKAYNNYKLFDEWTKNDTFFVTRLKENAKERLVVDYDLPEATPNQILKDADIELKYKDKNGQEKQVLLRMVSYYDTKKNKCYYFLTNLFEIKPEQVTDLYKKRWQIETMFKKIKQNFPLQYFYGDNQNAIQIQIWVSLIALLLISVMKKTLNRVYAFSNLLSLIQKHLFTYVKFTTFFNNIDQIAKKYIKQKVQNIPQQIKLDLTPT